MARVAVTLTLVAGAAAPGLLCAGPAVASAEATGVATAVFTKVSQWPGGYLGDITVHNGTPTTMTGWTVAFTLPAGDRMTGHFKGHFEQTGNRYTVTDLGWNGTLAPGASASFGWVAAGQGVPADCTLNGASCAGAPLDYTDPSRPGDLRLDMSNGVTLLWEPSADDRGVAGYQVFESGLLLRTVTGTRYVYSTGAALPPKVYVFAVRAVDAAGNPSPFAFRALGPSWPDEAPAAPTGLRIDNPGGGLLRLSWAAASDPGTPMRPPVAGYEVYVDGVRVGQAGRTSFTMPAPRAGQHTFAVRTFNAVDRYSAPAEIVHVVT